MSTELKPLNDRTTLTRFYGGARGTCVQVTQNGQERGTPNPLGMGYVQLTRDEALLLGEALLRFASDPMNPELEA